MKNFITFLVLPLAIIGLANSTLALDAGEHNTSISADLKPASNSFQIAKSTFLPDRYEDLGLSNYDTLHDDYNAKNCENYKQTSCPSVALCEKCPFNTKLLRVIRCAAPYLLTDGDCVCPPAKPLTCTNDKCTKYCGSTCIEKTCTPTPSVDAKKCTNKTRKCDNGCCSNTRDCCNPCVNTLTSKPENSHYTYCDCTDDDGTKKIQCGCECDTGYHLKNGTCGKGGICEKDCIANNCSGYDLSSCPAYGNCSKCTVTATNCSTDGTKYKLDSCQSGYSKSGNTCVKTPETCDAWIRENFPDVQVVTSSSSSIYGKKVALLTNINATQAVSVASGGFLVGPKYFNNEKCQQMNTPTLSVKSYSTGAVSLSGGTISDLNIHFNPVVYEIWGRTGICSYAETCLNSPSSSNFYSYVKSYASSINCSRYDYNPKNDNDVICLALSMIGSDCKDYGNNLKTCSSGSYYGCSCESANSMACSAFYNAGEYCANNQHGAIEGYGTVNNISLTTEANMCVADIIKNTSGTITLTGNNNLVGSTSGDRRGSAASAVNMVIENGSTKMKVGDNFNVAGTLTIKEAGALYVEYADLGGLRIDSGKTVNVYGKLNISSYGSGGKFNNDVEMNKGVINAKSTSCIIFKNGGGGDGGYTGATHSGTFNFETGSQLKIGGTCKKATRSGSASIGDNSSNSLYGSFTTPPSGYSGSCSSCS